MRPDLRPLVFIGYSHRDIDWLKHLQTHLSPLLEDIGIFAWDDRLIKPGEEWFKAIDRALLAARVAVLLVTPDFLALVSDFIKSEEWIQAVARWEKGELTILWIAVRVSDVERTEIGKFQGLNNPSRPLASLSPGEELDQELIKLCLKIKEAIPQDLWRKPGEVSVPAPPALPPMVPVRSRDQKKGIEAALERTKKLVAAGQFYQARQEINWLPNRPEQIKELKRKLLSQIDEAKEIEEAEVPFELGEARRVIQQKCLAEIEEAEVILEFQELVKKGEFEKAKKRVRQLPEAGEEDRKRKQRLLDQIQEAEQAAALHKRVKAMVGKGEFHSARLAVRQLPDQPEQIKELKRNLLSQIGEAEEASRINERIDAVLKETNRLVGLNQFAEARWTIQQLPDSPAEIRDLKKNVLGQIDQAEAERIAAALKETKRLLGLNQFAEARHVIRQLPDSPAEIRDLKKNVLGQIDQAEAERIAAALKETKRLVGLNAWWYSPISKVEKMPKPGAPELQEAVAVAPSENVQFTVYRPRTVCPERWYPLLAFAHLSDQPILQEVRHQAEQLLGGQFRDYQHTTQDASQAVPIGSPMTLVPQVEGVEFNPPERSFCWHEALHREEFRCRATRTLDKTTARGRLSVYLGPILLAEVILVIQVDSGYEGLGQSMAAPAPGQQPAHSQESSPQVSVRLDEMEVDHARPYRYIFASYSHRDRAIVELVERFVGTLGDSYLRDVTELRSGEVWNERLEQMIGQADVFQLFWSRNSMCSPFVRQEWEFALALGKANFIRPTYWEEPFPEDRVNDLPPEGLRRLHFQRILLEAQSMLQRMRSGRNRSATRLWWMCGLVGAALLAFFALWWLSLR